MGCQALGNLALTEEQVRKSVITCNGIVSIVTAMQLHQLSASVQRAGVCALGNIAIGVTMRETALRLPLASWPTGHSSNWPHELELNDKIAAGGIPVILAALRTHRNDCELQENGVRALLFIGWASASRQRRINSAGGVAVVQEAMRAVNATQACKREGESLMSMLQCSLDDSDMQKGHSQQQLQECGKHKMTVEELFRQCEKIYTRVYGPEHVEAIRAAGKAKGQHVKQN